MKNILLASMLISLVSCAQTSIQPLSQNRFKVDTVAAPACGPAGAREVAFKAAAIEVIKRGKDKFIIESDQGGPGQTTVGYSPYTGFQSYTDNRQNMVVKLLEPRDPDFRNGLSAREILGPDWQLIVAEGTPDTCSS